MATEFEQELTGVENAGGLLSGEPAPLVEETPAAEPEIAQEPEGRVPVWEHQELRAELRRSQEENHALRMASLSASQQISQAQPSYDPLAIAMGKIKAKMDPDAFRFMEPALEIMVQQLWERQQFEASQGQFNQEVTTTVNKVLAETQEQKAHSFLASKIPDLSKLAPQMLELVGKASPRAQQKYADDPDLLIPLAEALRKSAGTAAKNTVAERNKVTLDAGTGGAPPIPRSMEAIASLRPGSPELQRELDTFWGSANGSVL